MQKRVEAARRSAIAVTQRDLGLTRERACEAELAEARDASSARRADVKIASSQRCSARSDCRLSGYNGSSLSRGIFTRVSVEGNMR
jgi:hypothetical protein